MILGVRTDSARARILIGKDHQIADQLEWEAGKQLSAQLLEKIKELIEKNDGWDQLDGLVVFSGPGSFTGLRIGATVCNTIAYSLNKPIVGSDGDNWFEKGAMSIHQGKNDGQVIPNYGAEPNISKPKQ